MNIQPLLIILSVDSIPKVTQSMLTLSIHLIPIIHNKIFNKYGMF